MRPVVLGLLLLLLPAAIVQAQEWQQHPVSFAHAAPADEGGLHLDVTFAIQEAGHEERLERFRQTPGLYALNATTSPDGTRMRIEAHIASTSATTFDVRSPASGTTFWKDLRAVLDLLIPRSSRTSCTSSC